MRTPRRRSNPVGTASQGGITLVLFAIATMTIVAMAGLALDLGVAYLTKTRVQNALDAAALAGAKNLALLNSTSEATTAALTTFNLNGVDLNGAPPPTVEFSPTLTPFASGGPDPKFVKVSVPALPVPAFFARVLPAIGDTLDVGGTAIAGPEPLGGEVCRALPVAVCGLPVDSDCSDGACFGLIPDPLTGEIQIRGDSSALGPGNYGFVQLSCGGADCLRNGMAGGGDFCFNPNGTIETEPGVNSGPASQGLNTRFGVYHGPVSSVEYPPDVVTVNNPWPLVTPNYAAYMTQLANPASWNFPNGVPQRRVVPAPVVDCSVPVTGHSTIGVLGTACFFLTRQVQGSGANAGVIYAEIAPQCVTQGGNAEDPPPDATAFEIVLYGDPG